MEKHAEVEAQGGHVTAELAAGRLGKAFCGLQFHNDALLDKHIDSMKADLLPTESDGDRVLAIDSQPFLSECDVEPSRIDGLDEAIPELVVNVKKPSNNDAAEILFNELGTRTRRRCIRVIRFHSGNSAVPLLGRAIKIFHRVA